LEGKVVLITGGTTGIGLATAELFLKEGAKVVIAGRRAEEGNKAVQTLQSISREIYFVRADVSKKGDVENLIKETIHKFHRLDIAFNNAGISGKFSGLEEASEADFDAVIDINLKGAWLCCKYEFEQMKRQDTPGVIINTSSWLSKGAFGNSSIYSASKAGVDGMIKAIAIEGASVGIRINNINPGYIVTPMFEGFMDPEGEEAEAFKKHAPAGRFGQANEIAELVLWLSSDRAKFITGQSISIDGGLTIPGPR
jgi:NAD(P)-dependent dehydrogenase (short-subunit alcohol dehydrogenase family)